MSESRGVIVVTGAGGMGSAIARRIGTGSTVVLADFNQQLLEAEARQRQILDLDQRRFQAGDIDRTTVLQAQRSLLSQQDQSLQAQSQSLTALVSIYKSLGGGWE